MSTKSIRVTAFNFLQYENIWLYTSSQNIQMKFLRQNNKHPSIINVFLRNPLYPDCDVFYGVFDVYAWINAYEPYVGGGLYNGGPI